VSVKAGPILLTVALPVYNEERILSHLHDLLTKACQSCVDSYEILYVDDGSTDQTPRVLDEITAHDPHASVITLSRNFGHPAALAAAIDLASGQSLVIMDSDLQDDPGAIPELVRRQREEDAEVIYVVRGERKEGWMRRRLVAAFHWLIAGSSTYPVPENAGSFGLVGPRALVEIRKLTERLRYFPGLRAFVGFKQIPVVVPRGARYDDLPRHGFRWLLRYAGLALFSQSRLPVTLFYVLSGASLLVAVVLAAYAVFSKIFGYALLAWTSTITTVAFFSAVIILGQAFICEYLAHIYEEVRRRPIYIVQGLRRARVARDDGASD
jgi:dolichol-phosphate mannosyltransferase